MTTLLLIWYAFGWASVGIFTTGTLYISACDLVWMIVLGGISFFFSVAFWVEDRKPTCPIIWRKP